MSLASGLGLIAVMVLAANVSVVLAGIARASRRRPKPGPSIGDEAEAWLNSQADHTP